ncbi:MAG TPA: hypothetical protein VMT34_11840 [Aggregatilineales bacterium]|nr:hypothetical protein [Aggregatilineales bacterium]
MYERQAIIERVRRISPTLQRLDLAVEAVQKGVRPGQLFLVRAIESLDPYLREPWTPIRVEGRAITVERPAITTYVPGQVISILGPVGKPIALREATQSLLLLACESTPSALLYLAETAIGKGMVVTLVLLGAARSYPLDALPEEMEIVRGETHKLVWPERERIIRWADHIVAVAPPPFDLPFYADLLALIRKVRLDAAPGYAVGLFQPPMPCGVGACGACLIRRQGGEVTACIEGPAFDLTEIEGAIR